VSQYQKGKTNIWILLEQETVSGSGISWAICKSAPRSRQIITQALHYSSFFTGRMPFLPPSQHRQSTEDISNRQHHWKNSMPRTTDYCRQHPMV